MFAVTLRDAGQAGLIDGDTHRRSGRSSIPATRAVSRLSASADMYVVGRDGLTTIIDMFYEEPTTVATVKASVRMPVRSIPPSSRATRTST